MARFAVEYEPMENAIRGYGEDLAALRFKSQFAGMKQAKYAETKLLLRTSRWNCQQEKEQQQRKFERKARGHPAIVASPCPALIWALRPRRSRATFRELSRVPENSI
jgi:hypothetical protein